MSRDDGDRPDRYRAALDEHEASLDAARDQLDRVEELGTVGHATTLSSRRALTGGGLLATLGIAAGTASADPTGQVGTADRPVDTVTVAAIDGPLTGGERITSLVGDGLAVENGALTTAGGS